MKTMTKRLISIVLTIMMLMTSIPFSTMAVEASDNLCIYVAQEIGFPGETVDVEISIRNNPGLGSLKFDVEYGDRLTLEGVSFDSAFGSLVTAPTPYTNPQTLSCMSPLSEITAEGVFATLTFAVSEDAPNNYASEIKIIYNPNDICDGDLVNIDTDVENGKVTICHRKPGDANGDDLVDNKDAILVFRHSAGWDVNLTDEDKEWMDVNGDFYKDNKDAILIFRASAGWDVKLLPPPIKHVHDLTAIPAKEASCTENGNIAYWSCNGCDKLFSDAEGTTEITFDEIEITGHKLINVPEKEATEIEKGNIEYWYCSKCEKLFTDAQGKNETTADKIEIPIVLLEQYNIQYYCEMVPLDSNNNPQSIPTDTYRPSEGKVLYIPKMDKYDFLGWSDKNGKWYGKELPIGTTGHLKLYANWASHRNRAVPVSKLGDPIICEDSDAGQIIFVYEIGEIQKVPLFVTQKLLCANGVITSTEITTETSIQKTNAENVGKSISNMTTDSSAWTFSEDWNEVMSVSQEWAEAQQMTVDEATSFSKGNSNTFNTINSTSLSESLVKSGSSYFRQTNDKAHVENYYDEEQKYTKFNIDGNVSASINPSWSLGVGAKVPLKGVELSADTETGISNTLAFEIGAGYEEGNFTKDIKSGTDSWSESTDSIDSSSTVASHAATFNNSESFTASEYTSSQETVSKAVSDLISQKNSKDSTYTTGSEESQTKQYASSNASEDKYSSSVTYSSAETLVSKISFTSNGNTYGGYRLVQTGTARVFAVVGYDITNKAYYTYTYSVLDDDEYEEWLDYSYDGSFNDYESSVLPFEIPIFVYDYVNSRTLSSDIQVNSEGIVTAYNGSKDAQIIAIPSYHTRVNSTTEKPEMIKVVGIKEGLFKDMENLVGVSLGNFITEIPKDAFNGCTNLKEVICPNVTKIGENAFKGCISLSEFSLPNEVEYVGELKSDTEEAKYAFDGVPAVKVNAPTKEIASVIASSNIDNITLDISRIEDSDFSDMTLTVGNIDTFKLLGGYKEYNGLSISSDADETIISGVTIPESNAIPLETSSEKVTLERTELNGTGWALVLKANNTILSLEGESALTSDSDHAAITKNIEFVQINNQTYSAIETDKTILVCGEITNNNGFLDEDYITYLSPEDFNDYLSTRTITFNPNGGSVSVLSKTVIYGESYGELPTPTRDYYTFNGWFTENDTEVTSETIFESTEDVTLYAHWTINPLSDWVLSSEMPEGADPVNTKYTYTRTDYTTSSNSTLSGWTLYDTTFAYSDYGAWSDWSDSEYYSSEFRNVKTQTVLSHYEKKTQYFYTRYYGWSSNGYYVATPYSSGVCTTYQETGWMDSPLAYEKVQYFAGVAYDAYGYKAIDNKAIYWYNPQTRTVDDTTKPVYKTQWSYQDRYKIYTYYFYQDHTNLESGTYPIGDNLSNIQEWVQYRAK